MLFYFFISEFINTIHQHLGGIYDFLEKKKMESLRELEVSSGSVRSKMPEKRENQKKGLSFEEQKEINRSITRLERLIEGVENEIEDLEAKIAAMDKLLTNPENVTDPGVYENYEIKKKKLAAALKEWESRHEELESWILKKDW